MHEWDSALWIWASGLIFAVSHSLLASQACKQWAYGRGLREPRYRLLYSVFAMIATGAWVFFVHQLPDSPLYQTGGLFFWFMVTAQVLGVLIVLAAFQPIDGLVFLGLRQSSEGKEPFVVRGVYRYVRHPMYAGVMLILLAMPEQTWSSLHFALAICLYFMIGSRYEETRMLAAHPEYAAYRNITPAFIPFVQTHAKSE